MRLGTIAAVPIISTKLECRSEDMQIAKSKSVQVEDLVSRDAAAM